MTDIEKVARAFPALWDLVQYHKSGGHSGSGGDRALANALREVAAIAAMQPAPQWQGIETAPRDGRAILVGCWVGSRWSWWQTFSDGGPLGNDGEFGDEPTHWADAPTPPAGGSDAER